MRHHRRRHHRRGNQSAQFVVFVTLNFTEDLPNGPYFVTGNPNAYTLFISQKGTAGDAYNALKNLTAQVLAPEKPPP